MRKIDILKLALQNVFNSRVKTFLSALSICIGISSVCLVLEIGQNVSGTIKSELGQISNDSLTISPQNGDMVSSDIENMLASNENIKSVMPYIFEYTNYYFRGEEHSAVVCGISQKVDEIFNISLLYGTLPTISQTKAAEKVIVVDDILAKKLYFRENIVGKSIRVFLNGKYEIFEIIGVIKSQKGGVESLTGQDLPDLLYTPYTTINELFGKNKVSSLAVRCFSTGDASKNGEQVINILEKIDADTIYDYDNVAQYADTFLNIINLISILVGSIAAISVIVGGIGIMNSMVSSAESRINEIGIYLAIGAKRRDVLMCFITEALIVSLIGGFIGILFSSIAVGVINRLLIFNLTLNIKSLFIGFLGAAVCGIVFGFLPAYYASKLNPIDAISRE